MTKLRKWLFAIGFIVVGILWGVAIWKLGPSTATFNDFCGLVLAEVMCFSICLELDMFARQRYGGKIEYVLFWLGPVGAVLFIIFVPTTFPFPRGWLRVLFLTTYLFWYLVVHLLFVSKKWIFKEESSVEEKEDLV